MAAAGVDRAALGLAVLFHDPPWKPWGIRAERVRGDGGSVEERILGALGGLAKRDSELDALVAGARQCLGRASGDLRAHERQALILVGALLGELGRRGAAERTVEAVEKACEALAGRERVIGGLVKLADVLASSVDRYILLDALRAAGLPGDTREPSGQPLRLVNPFNPHIYLEVPGLIDAEAIARFIVEYVRLVGELVGRACRGDDAGTDCGMTLLHVAFSVLEPAWYRVVGGRYVPPADTRMPTHTVFDHANAALAIANLLDENGRMRGCMALVDFAGVQAWIGAARRTRDLWAASWLASLLTWKAVEPLVKRYGPGVLVKPPARLHPFYASWLLGELKYASIRDLEHGLGAEAGRWLAAALGVPRGWPVDPTVPSRVLLALPPEACEGFRDEVINAYVEAWRTIVGRAVGLLRAACQAVRDKLAERLREGAEGGGVGVDPERKAESICPVLRDDVYRLALEVEPPLAARLASVEVRDVVGERPSPARFARGFVEVLDRLHELEGAVAAKASGHSGPRFLELARRLHEAHGSEPRSCTICGAPALVDGRSLMDALRPSDVEELRRKNDAAWRALVIEVGRERLCVYCLVKRLLRAVLRGDGGLAAELTGLRIEGEAEEAIQWPSLDDITARAVLAKDAIAEAARKLLDTLAERSPAEAALLVVETRRRLGLPSRDVPVLLGREGYERVLRAASRGWMEGLRASMAEWAVGLVVEYIHARESVAESLDAIASARRELTELVALTRRVLDEAWEDAKDHRAVYAILSMDADFMGKRLLKGCLPSQLVPSTREYYEMVLWIHADREKYRRVAEEIARHVACSVEEPGQAPPCTCIPVTPSYYFTLSRALMALTALDREAVEANGGRIVYSGGDDLLALLPPVRLESTGEPRPAALAASIEARRNYWAAGTNGFTVVNAGDGSVVTVVPAPVAYGRSGALLFASVDTPMWVSVSLARELEEAKDAWPGGGGARTEDLARHSTLWWKDAFIIAGEAAGAVALPFALEPPSSARTLWPPRYDAAVGALLDAIAKRRISASLLYDATGYVELIYVLAASGRIEEAARVAYSLFARNSQEEPSLGGRVHTTGGTHPTMRHLMLAGELSRLLGVEWERLFSVGVSIDVGALQSGAREMLEASAYAARGPGGQLLVYQLFSALLGATRILRSSM